MVLYCGKLVVFQSRRNAGLRNDFLHGLSPDVTKIDLWSKTCSP